MPAYALRPTRSEPPVPSAIFDRHGRVHMPPAAAAPSFLSPQLLQPERRVSPPGAAIRELPVAWPSSPPQEPALSGQGAYGPRIARLFHLDTAQTLATTMLKTAKLAATRLTSGLRGVGATMPIPAEKAYLVSLQLRDLAGGEVWKGGRCVATGNFPEGSIGIVDLAEEPVFHLPNPFDCLQFYIPEIAFDELADDYGAPRITGFDFRSDTVDPVMQQLGRALLPVLEDPLQASRLFFDHVALAVHAHLAVRYGRIDAPPPRSGGRLAAWQERLAKELLVADLTEEPSIAEIARACGMPEGRFVRLFRLTTGMPPYRWVRAFRVEQAKELLFNASLSLAQIAYDCGFADQSHFTRVFSAATGTTPGAWRSARRA
jgi:AraC-like DNA-binding protein